MNNRPGWDFDRSLNAYKTARLGEKFACNCGTPFSPVNDLHRCACGQSWASFVISSSDKTAAQALQIVRPVAEHRDRVLAKVASAPGRPFFVRANQSEDPAPTVLEDDHDSRTAAGGWGSTKTPGWEPMAEQPEVDQLPAVKPYTPESTQYPNGVKDVAPAAPKPKPVAVTPQKRTKTMARTDVPFNESQFRHGWAYGETGSSLDRTSNYHPSFVEGYTVQRSEFLRQAEKAPGWDTVAPAFESNDPKKTNTMSDYTDTKEDNLNEETASMRSDLKTKFDRDNAAGQSRSNDTMADFDGWNKNSGLLKNFKTSSLWAELNRRYTED